jgi:hypothetical protein
MTFCFGTCRDRSAGVNVVPYQARLDAAPAGGLLLRAPGNEIKPILRSQLLARDVDDFLDVAMKVADRVHERLSHLHFIPLDATRSDKLFGSERCEHRVDFLDHTTQNLEQLGL